MWNHPRPACLVPYSPLRRRKQSAPLRSTGCCPLSGLSAVGGWVDTGHQLRKGTILFGWEKEFFPTLFARSAGTTKKIFRRARGTPRFFPPGARRAARLRQLPRAFGKTLAAGATTGRAREAIFGGETVRVFTSTRGALRPSRGTSSGASAGSGGRRGRVPAFPISSVTSVDVPSRRPRQATATRWPPREPPWRTPPYLRSRSPA